MSSRSDLPRCDLVMKGGVTSGIVYPPAINELSRKYRFRKIGGTSAGAIAAACAAAAEFGSECGKAGAGFEGFDEISKWLGEDGNLLGLFQPTASTRPLFQTFLALTAPSSRGASKSSFVGSIVRTLWRFSWSSFTNDTIRVVIGAVVGIAIALLLRWLTLAGSGVSLLLPPGGLPSVWFVVGGVLAAWLGGVIAGVISLARIAMTNIPQSFYGMCEGHIERPSAHPALTDWLHEKIQALAGLGSNDPPLTFDVLGTKDISLTCISSNLSQGQPYDLPFSQNDWIFNEDEMRALFPTDVVKALITKAHQSKRVSLANLPKFHYLPEQNGLPIVVAMRMSLSFPVLISAVPLYQVKPSAYGARRQGDVAILVDADADLQKNWFSDGGISSNFPIHFFDAWLPECPTFGINLQSMPSDVTRDHVQVLKAGGPLAKVAVSPDGQVFLPAANAVQSPECKPLPQLPDFLGAIWNTAQNYRDITQSLLPSYRERIVNIRLSNDEGGLNLSMGSTQVQSVQTKGREAGALLRDHFEMNAHRWVRLQVLMSQLEQELKQVVPVIASQPYQQLLNVSPATGGDTSTFPYNRDADWRKQAEQRLNLIIEAIARWKELDDAWLVDRSDWKGECFFPYRSPRPEPVLRVMPRL